MKLSNRIRAWLELLRAPNLLTVPGDPLAGFLLSGGAGEHGITHAIPVALSSMCFYCFGLIMNDVADAEVDRAERPSRPIPSGRISLVAAKLASVFFLVWGLAMAWLTSQEAGVVASALAGAVVAYNVLLKNRPLSGPVSMGACRGLSLMLGAAAGGGVNHQVAIAIIGVTLYVAAFSVIARQETRKTVFGVQRWLPAAVLIILFSILLTYAHRSGYESLLLIKSAVPAVLAVALAILCGRRLVCSSDVPGVIGGYIANMMLVQAGLCTFAGIVGLEVGALIACMVPVFLLLSLRFYSS